MRRAFFVSVFFCAFLCRPIPSQTIGSSSAPLSGPAQPSYYVTKGDTLQVVAGDPAGATYANWQVWLYPRSVAVGRSIAGLAYVRWGVIEGASSGAVMRQLAAYQEFERAYTRLFGPNAWDGFTFFYSVGPIGVANEQTDSSNTLLSRIDYLNQRLDGVVVGLSPSLMNAQPSEATVLLEAYFEHVRNSMQDVARFYDKLGRLATQRDYLYQELALLTPGVSQAESGAAKVTALLPSVRLPADKNWMNYSQSAGRDGTVSVSVTEIGSSAWVEESWSGGDGSMSGTNIITIVPFEQIGSLDVRALPSLFRSGSSLTLTIHSANPDGFPQSVTSPLRTTATRTYPAVDLKTSDQTVYLEFSNPAEAENAYVYFLYHKQRGS
jgi:hypothetical protein